MNWAETQCKILHLTLFAKTGVHSWTTTSLPTGARPFTSDSLRACPPLGVAAWGHAGDRLPFLPPVALSDLVPWPEAALPLAVAGVTEGAAASLPTAEAARVDWHACCSGNVTQ